MDEPRETKHSTLASAPSCEQAAPVDDADAAIAWYMSDEFEEHVGRCFEEGKRKALEARERFLRDRAKGSTPEQKS